MSLRQVRQVVKACPGQTQRSRLAGTDLDLWTDSLRRTSMNKVQRVG